MYAEILLPRKIGKNDSILTYKVPQEMSVTIGQNVKVPLRKGFIHGLVWRVFHTAPDFRTLPIKEVASTEVLLTQNSLKLMKWISEQYFCPLHKVLTLFIPKRILENKPVKTRNKKIEQIKRSSTKKLNKEQENVVRKILNSKENNFLIHGITGSGKTEIYCHIAKHHLKNGEQVLILVPEISLTPQTIKYFENHLGLYASVIHSKLSMGQRHENWLKIQKGESNLVIGSRSAIFAPFKNLGLIIIDEEHESSYKQDSSPRYLTHKVAEKIQELNPNTKIILGSATPSIETSEKLKKTTLMLTKRIGTTTLPKIQIVDLREEFQKKNYSIFSDTLRAELTKTLKNKEQALLFINRRGSATSVVCRDCGTTEKCRNCEIPLTYHGKTLKTPILICHHCGIIGNPPLQCRVCQSTNIRFLGIGTQRIESELKKEFPHAKTLRADKDTTGRKDSFKKLYEDFLKHKADILIGTQMISKGLHLPKVSLVGVILADIGLNIPDFRGTERNFQLLTQVAGRAGRGKISGKVIIQTYNPENIALSFAREHNYEALFKYEITQRKLLKYPPFSNLAKILIEGESFQKSHEKSEELEKALWRLVRENHLAGEVEIFSYPAYIIKLRNKYRHIVLIKTPPNQTAHKLLEKLPEKYIMDGSIKIDINPLTLN